MTPPHQKDTKVKTSIVMRDDLLQALRHAAIEERIDMSALLTRLVEAYLKTRKGASR